MASGMPGTRRSLTAMVASGHFPGSLWYLYEATGDEFFKERATVWTEIGRAHV